MRDEIVITGMGVVAPIGLGRDQFCRALLEGRSGIGEAVAFDTGTTGRRLAAEVAPFDESAFLRSPKNYLDRNSLLAMVACEMAVRSSAAALPSATRREGIAVGTAAGNVGSLAFFHAKTVEKGPRLAPPFIFPHTYLNTTVGLLAIEYGLGGPHGCFCTGGLAGLESVAWAVQQLRWSRSDLMVAGGVEALDPHLHRAIWALGRLSPLDGGEEGCRPFASDRNGTVLGEGAAFFVIEDAAHAAARGASVMARVLGWGRGGSARLAIERALASADVGPGQVDAVFAAAGGYPREDEEEATALAGIFARDEVSVIAPKAFFGETLGASGALSLAAAVVAIEQGIRPSIHNSSADLLAPFARPPSAPLRVALVNAVEWGGTWGSLLVGR